MELERSHCLHSACKGNEIIVGRRKSDRLSYGGFGVWKGLKVSVRGGVRLEINDTVWNRWKLDWRNNLAMSAPGNPLERGRPPGKNQKMNDR